MEKLKKIALQITLCYIILLSVYNQWLGHTIFSRGQYFLMVIGEGTMYL